MCCVAMADQGRPKVLQGGCVVLQWQRGCCNGGRGVAIVDGVLQDGKWDVAMADEMLQDVGGCV